MQPILSQLSFPAPMHGTKLVEQADEAFHLLQQVAGADSKTTQEFWHTISSSVDHREQLSEWCKLAGIAQVQVPGSVEEERVFSTTTTSRTSGATAWMSGT